MTEICIVYLSEDETVVGMLVSLLRKHWDVWWARDLAHGAWEEAVRAEISRTILLVPVLSHHATIERMAILKDEMRYAKDQNKPILPFIISPSDIPFGFGDLNHTLAYEWNGEEEHQGFKELFTRIAATIEQERTATQGTERLQECIIQGKTLKLPAFSFSLSSHETQVTPNDGARLLQLLDPEAVLVSAYDAFTYVPKGERDKFLSSVKRLCQSDAVLILDSGNYEAYRKNDRYFPKINPNGWRKEQFHETAIKLSPDLAFSFDSIYIRTDDPNKIAKRVITDFRVDNRAMREATFPLCPIIHFSPKWEESIASNAAQLVSLVASELDPIMLAIPERELGDGLRERAKTVQEIRRALNALGKYYPLHLLGTGNPLSMIALAAAGADSFDGLEWCRTVADYPTGFLFHFQHFDCFSQACLHRVRDQKIKHIIGNPDAPYLMRALGFNVDFFKDWTRTMRSMIHSAQVETLLNMIPNIGPKLYKDLS